MASERALLWIVVLILIGIGFIAWADRGRHDRGGREHLSGLRRLDQISVRARRAQSASCRLP